MLKTILSNWLMPALVLIVLLFAAYFFGAGPAGVIVGILFCLTLAMAIFSILQKQKKLYREKRISRTRLALNLLAEIMMILVGMILAGWLGRYFAEIATAHISNDLTKLIAGMVIGLLAGMGVGFLVKRTWGRLAEA